MTAFPEAPFGAMDRLTLDAVPLAVVRHERITIADLRDVFDAGYAALGRLFADGILSPAGPAIAVYDGDPMEVFDPELGFPVVDAPNEPIDADGVTVTASALPAGEAIATTMHGSYDGLGAAWMELMKRTVAAGLHPRGLSIEVYVSDPTEAPEVLRTDLIMPLA